MKKHETKGFTLVELLVVIAIIAILITLVLPGLMGAGKRAKMTKCQNNMKGLYKSLIEYSMDYGNFPDVPGMTGWDYLRTKPTPGESILGGTKERDVIYACPVQNGELPIGSSDYLGPAAAMTGATAENTAVVIDKKNNHDTDNAKDTANVLYFGGSIIRILTTSGEYSDVMSNYIEVPPP